MLTATTAIHPVVNQTFVEVNGTNLYGLDAELYLKKQAKYNVEEEKQAGKWIENMIDETLKPENGDLYDKLKSGIALCKLINVIRPGLIPKIHERSVPLLERENIGFFLEACKNSFHLSSGDLFVISDLYERKDIHQVLTNVYAFARHIYHQQPATKLRLQRSATAPGLIILPKAEPTPPSTDPPRLKWSERQKLSQQQQLTQRAKSVGEISISISEDDPNSLEFLFSKLSLRLKLKPTDERLTSAVQLLKNNAFDSRESLKGLGEEDYVKMNIPLRVAKDIIKVLQEEEVAQPAGVSFYQKIFGIFACFNPFPIISGIFNRSLSTPPPESIEV